MTAHAERERILNENFIEHLNGRNNLPRIFPGLNIFVGPGCCGKTFLCKKMLEISMYDSNNKPMFSCVIVLDVNPATTQRWKDWFKTKFNIDVILVKVNELQKVYQNIGIRYAECLSRIDPKTGRKYLWGPTTLIVIDDFAGSNANAGKDTRLLKNLPCIVSAALDGRNIGVYMCMIAQKPTMIAPDCYENSKFIAVGRIKNINTLKDHIIPKVLSQCTMKFPFTLRWNATMRQDWFARQMSTMVDYEFLMRYEYKEDGQTREEICFYIAD